MDPAEYLASSYWALWFGALETNLDDKQVVTLAETDARVRAIANGDVVPGTPPPRPEIFEAVDEAVHGGVSPARPLVGRPGTRSDRRCARGTRIRRVIRACPATCSVELGWSPACAGRMCCRMRTHTSTERAPSTSTPCVSRPATSGATWRGEHRGVRGHVGAVPRAHHARRGEDAWKTVTRKRRRPQPAGIHPPTPSSRCGRGARVAARRARAGRYGHDRRIVEIYESDLGRFWVPR